MDILEKLYLLADTSLSGPEKDWDGFTRDFKDAFRSNVALYQTAFEKDGKTAKSFSFVATSDKATTQAYLDKEIWRHNAVAETDIPLLEPQRRTDTFPNEVFENLGPLSDFFMGQGLYYFMVVPAVLSDGSFIGLFVWRDRHEADFTDFEKQRLALFMRHLLALVGHDEFLMNSPDENVVDFGTRWNLTDTEVEVLSALMHGLSLKEIAAQTDRSYGTVRWHVQNMLGKCQVTSQKALMREFYQLIQR